MHEDGGCDVIWNKGKLKAAKLTLLGEGSLQVMTFDAIIKMTFAGLGIWLS